LADIAENTAGIWELHERALVTKPVPNFTRLDPSRPDIAILMNANAAGSRGRSSAADEPYDPCLVQQMSLASSSQPRSLSRVKPVGAA
jgi:hypothetical protein